MRISENKLRRIIRNIISEDDMMRSSLAPMVKSGSVVDDVMSVSTVSKAEENAINDIITMPLNDAREKRINAFGREKFYAKCDALGIDPEEHYDHEISFSRYRS